MERMDVMMTYVLLYTMQKTVFDGNAEGNYKFVLTHNSFDDPVMKKGNTEISDCFSPG